MGQQVLGQALIADSMTCAAEAPQQPAAISNKLAAKALGLAVGQHFENSGGDGDESSNRGEGRLASARTALLTKAISLYDQHPAPPPT